MTPKDLTTLMFAESIISIIKEYEEVIVQPCMSDYKKEQAKLNAFDDILKEVDFLESCIKDGNL